MRRLGLLVAVLGFAGACGGEEAQPVGPVAGELTLSYSSPGQQDGALLVLVTGGPVEAVTPVGAHRVESAAAGLNATRVVVTGTLVPGDLLRVRVPDLARVSAYVARVEAAADRTTFALADPGLYTTSIRR